MRGAMRVDRPEGVRWELALDLLEVGSGSVALGELGIGLSRRGSGPRRDPHAAVEVTINASEWWRPDLESSYRQRRGQEQLDTVRALVAELSTTDERFGSLISGYGINSAIVLGYGNGAALLGRGGPSGDLTWA